MTAGYLDVSNYNPFEASESTATPGAENRDDQAEDKRYTNVPLNNSPVKVNAVP